MTQFTQLALIPGTVPRNKRNPVIKRAGFKSTCPFCGQPILKGEWISPLPSGAGFVHVHDLLDREVMFAVEKAERLEKQASATLEI